MPYNNLGKKRQWVRDNWDRHYAAIKRYRKTHRDQILAKQKEWRQKNKGKIKARKHEQPEYYRERSRRWYHVHWAESNARDYFTDMGIKDIPKELIELKAIELKIKRCLRSKKMMNS